MVDEPCYCRVLHLDCDPSSCEQAKYVSGTRAPPVSLRNLRRRADQGCQACATAVNAVLVPQVRDAWRTLIVPALEAGRQGLVRDLAADEEAIELEFYPPKTVNDRRIVRLRASDVWIDWMNFNLWREPTAGWQNKACRAFNPLKYQPTERTDSAQSLGHLNAWIKSCDQNHSCFDASDTELPTRLVKVADNAVKVTTKPSHQTPYTTLSHRWGKFEYVRLTKNNSDSLHQSIAWDAIPQTFRDAIWLTRQLGVDYIWIDSLCIVQNDAEDWSRESVKMQTVYGNSYLNIAASSGTDSRSPLFNLSPVPQQYPAYPVPGSQPIFIRQQPYRTHEDFGSNYVPAKHRWPLLDRGWVLQERLLSPRVVYFDTEELKWECMKTADCQCGAILSISNFKANYSGSVFRNERPLPFAWMRIAEMYSRLSLTFSKDRIVALSGIAKQASQRGRAGRYLAGVWEQDLAHQLCWEVYSNHKKPAEYVAPSWSWLSIVGGIENPNRMDYSKHSDIDVEITESAITTADGTDQMGPVVSGYLKFNGRCVEMYAELVDSGSQKTPPTYALKTTGESVYIYGPKVRMDHIMSSEEAGKVNQVLVVFWGYMCHGRCNFLVLKPVPGQGRTYERFGIFWYNRRHQTEKLNKLLGCCELQKDITFI